MFLRCLNLFGRILTRWATTVDRARISELEQELAETDAALRVAQKENTLLADIHEEDISRRKRERAIYDRDRAIATAATNPAEESE